jgi:hypothetical protein
MSQEKTPSSTSLKSKKHETSSKTELDFQFILNASASSSPSANALTGDVKPQTFNAK